ncbi:MAG: hypothetical protein QOH56_407 [Pseudonocardiales bacterium]|jgi:hypothetical protein|nr:hypothetical protein [Pseudonocardiales bacterium]MDQ1734156.1 hypothetical protein [Pseudonocardiales bacterium]MDQ1750868.1 hypothetical protein [Pseudonocardiales bacterium]
MLSPMMTVVVLAVLWLIVVIPMVIQKLDDRAGERSAARFSSAMRALGTRRSLGSLARPIARDNNPAEARGKSGPATRPQTFVPGAPASVSAAARRPVPAAMEAVMYPERVSKADMSEARRQMMTRRRRSLTLLILGTVIGLLWAVAAGGTLAWAAGIVFTGSLTGYLYFLRSQALRDRERRESRLNRSGLAMSHSYDLTEEIPVYTDSETVVRIDDDDVALHGMADTVDLTGLYQEEEFDDRAMRRAV